MTEAKSLPELLVQLGPDARWARVVVTRLAAGPATTDELVHASGLSRRTVERIVAAVDPSVSLTVDTAPDRARLPHLDIDPETIRLLADLIDRAPSPRPMLDQIPADAETVVARAALLSSQFDVAGGQLLFLGDHDLTSIAAALAMPRTEITVVDIDEALLEFIDGVARERSLTIHTLFGDLRDGLPDVLHGTAALVFTDPPYSADGVALFLERALAALANRNRGRVVIAYGAGDHRPDLALAVQERMQRLRVVIEAIYPSFNRYVLAQAIGGWSDLYVCRPTAGTWRRLGRAVAARNLYTHGPQAGAARGDPHSPAGEAAAALVPDGAVIDLRREPDELLLRVLMVADAPVAVIVRNNHRDIVDERSQRALLDLLEPRVAVRFHRSTPDSSTAIVTADPADSAPRSPLAHVPRHLLSQKHEQSTATGG
ncbi:MAG: bis-aminopropyl spermidine synthase family protein [Acidimicrobiia bacterium]